MKQCEDTKTVSESKVRVMSILCSPNAFHKGRFDRGEGLRCRSLIHACKHIYIIVVEVRKQKPTCCIVGYFQPEVTKITGGLLSRWHLWV